MEYFSITKTDAGIQIEGFPDAAKVIRIDGSQAKRLAALFLHETDLAFAAECLEMINQVPDEPPVLKQMLWRAAIFHYIIKCFGRSDTPETRLMARRSLLLKRRIISSLYGNAFPIASFPREDGPRIHQFPPLLEKIGAIVGRFSLVPQRMG